MVNQGESRTDFAHKSETAITGQLGRSVVVKGELTGSEDLLVDGRVEGIIDLGDHALTIGPNATISAEISARTVTIFGSVVGNVTVRETLHIRHGASLEGEVVCGAIVIQDRAHFCGTVEMPERRRAEADHELAQSAVA